MATLSHLDTEEQVIALTNDTEFGLTAYFLANNLGQAWRMAEALEYGMVGINSGLISTEWPIWRQKSNLAKAAKSAAMTPKII